LVFKYLLGTAQLLLQGARGQPRQVDVIVAVRLKRHARGVHLEDLSPTQKAWFADAGGIEEEIGSHPGCEEKWVGDFVG
jgi:hypothetical protein